MTPILMRTMTTLPVADILFAMRESNLSGKVIVLLLFLGSIGAWSVMISKVLELRRARLESIRFSTLFRREADPLSLFVKRRQFPESPLYRVYEQGCLAVGAELLPEEDPAELPLGKVGRDARPLAASQFEAVRHIIERSVTDQAMLLEDHMGFLATAVSASPFLGLLGTVWGVMDAFGGMAVTGSAQLSSVAPGISGALLTTVVGLIVAIPSAIGYNLLTHRIRRLAVQMDHFGQEFLAAVQRNYLED
jgi:biopolymer transport protein TolQ